MQPTRKCITHRDLNPANIMLMPEGTIRVLDFGRTPIGAVYGANRGMIGRVH